MRKSLAAQLTWILGALSLPQKQLPGIRDCVSKRNVPLLLYNVGAADPSVSFESRPHLRVICREFPPNTLGVCSVKTWTKGTRKIDIRLPNFAMTIRQCAETAKDLDAMVKAEYNKLVAELATGQDDIVSWTLAEAVRQAEKVSASARGDIAPFS